MNEEKLYDLAEFFKVLSEPTRLKILFELLESEKNVGDLVQSIDISQSAISHQLRLLRQNRFVKHKKDGKNVIYSLDDEHVNLVLSQGISHISHLQDYEED